MKSLIVLSFLFFSHGALAQGKRGNFLLSGGFALGAGQFAVANDSGQKAQFQSFSYLLQGGMELPLFSMVKLHLAGEMGETHAYNRMNSETSMEKANATFQALRGGFGIGSLGLGAGKKRTSLTIKTLDETNGYMESNQVGEPIFYYLNYSFDQGSPSKSQFRTTLELQHLEGKIASYQMTDTSLSLRFFILLDPF